ncbi:hypothetical protein [Rhizobium sp. BK060]|uniref:hypothetical protein n=1 Tax=Rhizobium sp. BK060 TaxID=2587096 RepID=UPI001616808B|nr:hypothetical protein [Rhizobium sp. BK060]MBB3394248.1 hypothetical protein [Rhizobium sp. BK060]
MAATTSKAKKTGKKAKPAAKVETQKAWSGRHNYSLNSDTVLRDVYRLLNVVMADEAIARLATARGDVLVDLRDQFVEDELVHLLISTAIMNRSHDDHMDGPRNDAAELSFAPVALACGRLVTDVGGTKEDDIELTFREACNKIIHAEHITVETQKAKNAAFQFLPTTVQLRGTLRKKPWVAFVDVPNYVRATLMNFRDLR